MAPDKDSPRVTPRDRLVEPAVGAALVLLTLLVYWPTFRYPFVDFDDPQYVFHNAHVQAGLTAGGVRWAFATFDCGNWHPLTWLSLQLDATLYGGLNAGGFHLTNVLLHAADTLLLFLVLGRMTGAVWRSGVVAGLFGLHPLHVESVAWVAERKDVLSTLFWMLALAAYLRYSRRPGLGRYLLVALALALGLLAKPMLVTLPCVLLLLDYWPLRRFAGRAVRLAPADPTAGASPAARPTNARRLLLEKLPLFALALASCAVTFLAQLRGQAVAPLEAIPLAARLGNALLAYATYLGKMLWPTRLAVYYPHRGADFSVAGALAAGGLLLGVTALALAQRWRRPYLAVGWLWYLGTLVPVIGLVQVGGQALADRYTYVPLIGVFLMLVWGAADLATAWRLPRPVPAGVAAAALCACAVLTWVQVGYWKSSLRVWEHTTAVTEENGLAHLNLGACYDEQRMLSDARREFEKAVALGPGQADPHGRLATVLAELGLWDQAAAEYRRAIDLDPDVAWPHVNLGRALLQLGRPEEALKAFRKAGDLDPAYAPSPGDLGAVFAELGRTEEATAEYRRAIDLDPGNARPHTDLGRLFQEEGRTDEALAEYRRALELGDQQAWPLLQGCERLAALRARLPDLAAGRDRPADNAERLALADAGRRPAERRYALAARLYAEAFAADAKLADDLRAAHRFHAAESAAAAGCGPGQDAGPLDDREKLRLRQQALDWLRADLAAWTRQADGDRTGGRVAAQRALRAWQRSAALAGVRDPAGLAELPADEREAWQKLWQEVAAVLVREHPR